MIEKFSQEVCQEIGYYVYRLVDPRNGMTFYVGKGKNNRVFDHVKYAEKLILEIENENKKEKILETKEEIESRLKLKTIREIQDDGLQVIHIIHRWGMKTDEEAYLVEAAVIDCFSGLTNIQSGHNDDYGVINAHTLQQIKCVSEFIEPENIEDFMIIKVKSEIVEERGRYDTTRCCWRISLEQAKKRKYVLSVTNGIVRAIYKVNNWRYVNASDTTLISDVGRVIFEGEEINSGEIYNTFNNKRIPEKYCKKGMASPCLYCKK
jgi:hypothetical protein